MILFKKYAFKCGESIFGGLKLSGEELFPEGHLDSLIEKGNCEAKKAYIECLDELVLEEVHIKLTYSYLLELFSLILIASLCLVIFVKIDFLMIGITFLTVIVFVFAQFLKKKAREIYRLKEVNKTLVELVFDSKLRR